jgi:hypothetical protein
MTNPLDHKDGISRILLMISRSESRQILEHKIYNCAFCFTNEVQNECGGGRVGAKYSLPERLTGQRGFGGKLA